MPTSYRIDVVGVGLNATDTLIPVHHYPAAGSKVEFRCANVLPGGQVATAMVACQSWGLHTRYVGKVGDDLAATLHRSEFARLGVETHLLTAPGCPSQQAFILVDDAGAQFHYAPAFRVDTFDTTGPGDIFPAGFIYGLLQGWPLQRQLEFACAAAALNCTGIGARGHIAPLAEIENLIATGQRHSSAF